VGRSQPGRDLSPDAGRFRGRQPVLAVEPGLQRLADEKLHRHVGPAVCLAHLIDRADVLLFYRGHRPGLAEEPLAGHLFGRQVGAQNLNGDPAVEPLVLGLEDDAHAAGPELAHQPVLAEPLADLWFADAAGLSHGH